MGYLEQQPELKEAMRQVVLSADGAVLHPEQAFKLQGLGLIGFQNQAAIPSSELYQKYFSALQ